MAVQLTFFPETKEDQLEKEVQRLHEQLDKVRKGQYAQIGQIKKICQEVKSDLEDFKMVICRGDNKICS